MKDFAFIVKHYNDSTSSSWTAFNQSIAPEDPPLTTIGYLPLIQAPAHELDTLNTVIQRCMYISSQLGQKYTVLTVDQALFCKVMELEWSIPAYKENLIPRLGGLHTSMNFLKIIGHHMKGSGLSDVWIESDILGPNSTERAMTGKDYNKAMRAHKLTFQAMWRILFPQFLSFMETHDQEFATALESHSTGNSQEIDDLITLLSGPGFSKAKEMFMEEKGKNVNFRFWWNYLEMVSILMMFTRAQREGNWDLHLYSFKCMLQYFMRYDHSNYARWGTVYFTEMHQLPAEVERDFTKGNIVVKRSTQKFNQVDPDQSQEWLNGIGKRGGGIVGITQTPTALGRWALSYNLRSHIAAETKELYHLGYADDINHNEGSASRQEKDTAHEDALYSNLQRFAVFSPSTNETLQNVATKDLVTPQIESSLIQAAELGQKQLDNFVQERLTSKQQHTSKKLYVCKPL